MEYLSRINYYFQFPISYGETDYYVDL